MEAQLSGLAEVAIGCAGFVTGYLYCLFMKGPDEPPSGGDYLVTTKEQFNHFLQRAQRMVKV